MILEKPFKTLTEQIEILKRRHLNIANEEVAIRTLQSYGYYEIINGYKDHFLINPNDDDEGYQADATFEHIVALYQLDSNIRNALMSSIEKFENTFKQSLSYTIAEQISDKYTEYSDPIHYDLGQVKPNGKTDRDYLLHKMQTIERLASNPYKHYRDHHGNVPPWILVKGLSLGQANYLYALIKDTHLKNLVISRMTSFPTSVIEPLDATVHLKQVFGDILRLVLAYRNLAAHEGRIYNHRSRKHAISVYSPLIYDTMYLKVSHANFKRGSYRSCVGALLACLTLFQNKDPFMNLSSWLKVHIINYLKIYPQDKEYILETLEIGASFINS